MRRLSFVSLLIVLSLSAFADSDVVVLNDPSSPVKVTKVSSEVVPADNTMRVTLTVQTDENAPEKAAVFINTFSSEGQCKKKVAIIRKINVDRRTEDWVVRVVRDDGDVTVIGTVDAKDLDQTLPTLEPQIRELAGKALGKDAKQMSGQCRLECRQFFIDCHLACQAAGFPTGCVCCRPVGAGSGPCDWMECYCGPTSSFCTPCPQ